MKNYPIKLSPERESMTQTRHNFPSILPKKKKQDPAKSRYVSSINVSRDLLLPFTRPRTIIDLLTIVT